MNIIELPQRPRLPRTLLKDGWWLVRDTRAATLLRFPPRVRSTGNVVPFPRQRRAIGAKNRVG